MTSHFVLTVCPVFCRYSNDCVMRLLSVPDIYHTNLIDRVVERILFCFVMIKRKDSCVLSFTFVVSRRCILM